MRVLYGFLVLTFIVHGAAFLILARKKQKPYYLALTGTFTFLTALYLLKYLSMTPTFPGTGISVYLVLRAMSIACTATYLLWISRVKGTWLSRLIGRG